MGLADANKTQIVHPLLVFNVILGSFGAPVSKWSATPKRLIVERNGVKFGTQGHQ